MLKEWVPGEIPEKEEMEIQLERDRDRLYELQMKIKEYKVPVLVCLRDGRQLEKAVQSER